MGQSPIVRTLLIVLAVAFGVIVAQGAFIGSRESGASMIAAIKASSVAFATTVTLTILVLTFGLSS